MGLKLRQGGAKTACRWGWDGDFCNCIVYITPAEFSILGIKSLKVVYKWLPILATIFPTTENLHNLQIHISALVHIIFFNVIIGKRKPPREPFLWRFWCARLDSNQRPTESELSGRQGKKPGFMRVSGTSHKISTHLQKPWEPLVRLGSRGFSGF